MTDAELIARLRGACYLAFDDWCLSTAPEAADRIEQLVATNEALTKERERLALAICGGEDVPGYANAQTVETLEEVARDWGVGMMEQINRTLALESKLATCEKYRDAYDEMGRIGTQAVRDLEAKLAKAVEIGNKMAHSIEGNYYLPNIAGEWRKVAAEIRGESHD